LTCAVQSKTVTDLTKLLQAWSEGDEEALRELSRQVYAELHRIARRYMTGERPGHMLQPTALINEAFLRLLDWKNVQWRNRCHFLAVSAGMMRRVLVDHARATASDKRGGAADQVTLDTSVLGPRHQSMDLVALNEALEELARFDPRKSRVVELRVFGGLSVEEVAEAMNVAEITVRRDWKLGLAWLRRELESQGESSL
jgi:RNA polymerase sigma factor (TIGR02999 family)